MAAPLAARQAVKFTSDHFIDVQSCQRARLQRLIRTEEARIENLMAMLQRQESQETRQQWIEARNRLRQLRLDLFKMELDCGWL